MTRLKLKQLRSLLPPAFFFPLHLLSISAACKSHCLHSLPVFRSQESANYFLSWLQTCVIRAGVDFCPNSPAVSVALWFWWLKQRINRPDVDFHPHTQASSASIQPVCGILAPLLWMLLTGLCVPHHRGPQNAACEAAQAPRDTFRESAFVGLWLRNVDGMFSFLFCLSSSKTHNYAPTGSDPFGSWFQRHEHASLSPETFSDGDL